MTDTERLAEEFPEWRFWETDGGKLMATRRRSLSDEEVRAGLSRTLPYGHDSTALEEQLRRDALIELNLQAH